MIKRKLICGLLMILIGAVGSPLLQAGNLSGQVDFMSRYMWRGWDLNPDKKPVLQPSLTYAFGDSGFSANIWFSLNFEKENEEVNETDITLTYDFKLSEAFTLSAGIIHYGWYLAKNFTFKKNTTHELFVSAALPKVPLNPSATLYYDFDGDKGTYILFSISKSVQVGAVGGLDLSAALGYNGGLFLDKEKGLSDLTIGAALPLKLGSLSLTGMANYTFVLLDEIGTDDHLWFGLSLAF